MSEQIQLEKEELDNVTLYRGDCLEIMETLPEKSVDITITSVPFMDKDLPEPFVQWLPKFHKARERITVDYSLELHSCTREKELMRLTDPFHWGVWYTKEMNTPYRYQNWYCYRMPTARYNIRAYAWQNHFTFGLVKRKEKIHINQDPIGPYDRLLHFAQRSKKSRIAIDPCMGSGTAIIAGIRRGFQMIGIEIDPKRYRDARKRIIEELAQSRLSP